jgi:hypothetical protein
MWNGTATDQELDVLYSACMSLSRRQIEFDAKMALRERQLRICVIPVVVFLPAEVWSIIFLFRAKLLLKDVHVLYVAWENELASLEAHGASYDDFLYHHVMNPNRKRKIVSR